jgi:hypothetical protein
MADVGAELEEVVALDLEKPVGDGVQLFILGRVVPDTPGSALLICMDPLETGVMRCTA